MRSLHGANGKLLLAPAVIPLQSMRSLPGPNGKLLLTPAVIPLQSMRSLPGPNGKLLPTNPSSDTTPERAQFAYS